MTPVRPKIPGWWERDAMKMVVQIVSWITIPLAAGWAIHVENWLTDLGKTVADQGERITAVETVTKRLDRFEDKFDRLLERLAGVTP